MTLLQSLLLGIIQGLTEFLPISSSAHLVIVPYLFNWQIPAQEAFIFDVLVQLGTLLAVIIYFRYDLYRIIVSVLNGLIRKKPLAEPMSRLGWMLLVATIPAVIAGVLFQDIVEQAFGNPMTVAFFLLGTAALLVIAELAGKRTQKIETIEWLDAGIIGIFQALSLFPGISRSGSTITGGMLRNLDRTSAARFSFLMSVPIMLGAGAKATLDLLDLSGFSSQIPALILGALTSALVGYLSIRWLLAFLVKRSLYIFSIYCVIVSILVLVISSVRA